MNTMHEPFEHSRHENGNSADVATDLQQLRADFGKLTESVAELVRAQANAAAASLRDGVSSAGERIGAKVADAGVSAERFASGAQEGLNSAGQEIQASIRHNPLAAALIAAGIGLLLGIVTARS